MRERKESLLSLPGEVKKQALLRSMSFIIMQSYCFFFFVDTERQGTEKLEKRRKKQVQTPL